MRFSTFLAAALAATSAAAQTPPSPASASPAAKTPDAAALASLSWLAGCWRGTAGPFEFREHWMPLQGAMMIGVSQTVEKGATKDYEFLRLEPRTGGVFYVASPSGKPETPFRLESETVDKTSDRDDTIFTFVNPKQEFPERITYRRSKEGWLYAEVAGKVGGAERKSTYPMRRIDCESGEVIPR
jgi:Domain of unknown function (DUF6265)